jgi:molecular chaperone GrpE
LEKRPPSFFDDDAGASVENSIKQSLMSRFEAYLDTAAAEEPEDRSETTDLYSLFVELAGLRSEVRTESRLMKDALDQFSAVFDTLQTSQATLQHELERARAAARDQTSAALRSLLLDVIDLRDRLLPALTVAPAPASRWIDRWRGRPSASAPGGEAWQDGVRMTLRRLDQVLLDRRVTPMQLVGLPFDPRRARVVATALDPSVPEGIVTEEVRAGFLWDDQVLRIGDVIVNKRTAGTGDSA